MKKICFFLGGFYQNGGIGRVTAMLANQLSKLDGYHIFVLCYHDPKSPNIFTLSANIKQSFFLKEYTNMTNQLLLGGVKRLRRYLLENEIDVLVACGALFYPISVIACKGIKTKCICWEHSNPKGNNDHKGQYLARRFGIRKSDLNVVLTKSSLKVYKEIFKANNTIQIYNPIDEVVFENSKEYLSSNKRIISVGRLSYQKNFEAAIEIASKILPCHPDWNWDVYGKGEYYDDLLHLIEERGISKQFHLCGQVNDIYERYGNYSIMVMTSRYEGFPMSLLEGLGNGLPLICFDVPTGPNEIIKNGENGYLIKAFDIDDFVKKLNSLINDESKRIDMSESSRRESVFFSQKEIVDQWNITLTNLCKK